MSHLFKEYLESSSSVTHLFQNYISLLNYLSDKCNEAIKILQKNFKGEEIKFEAFLDKAPISGLNPGVFIYSDRIRHDMKTIRKIDSQIKKLKLSGVRYDSYSGGIFVSKK